MNRKEALKLLNARKINKLPSGFYTGLSKTMLGELIRYAILEIKGYTEDDVYTITRRDLISMGFAGAMDTETFHGCTDTFSLLKLAFPDIKPWKMKQRPVGTFDNVDNIHELVMEHYQIGHPSSVKELRSIISDRYIYRHFKDIDDFNESHDRWIVSKRVQYAQLKQKKELLNNYICDSTVKLPRDFWNSLTSADLKGLVNFIVSEVFNENVDETILIRLDYRRILKARLSRLYKEIQTVDGEHVKGLNDLLHFTYDNLTF